jgi:tetratricopeptide (TPR) repeat protein
MANNCSVALLQAGEAQAALDAVAGTPGEFAAAGETRLQAMALGNQAAALDALDRLEEAEPLYLQAADLLQSVGETDLRAHLLQSLARLQLRSGRQLEALASMQAGIDGLQRPSLKQRLIKRLLKRPFDLLKGNG